MYFFDTYALFEIYRNNAKYAQFAEETIITCILNLGELRYIFLHENIADLSVIHALEDNLIEITPEIMYEAMDLKYKHKRKKMSMVDCVGYIIARRHNLLFLTGDKQFKNFLGVTFISS